MSRRPAFTPEDYRQRPRDYDPALARQIIDRIENGQSLFEVCGDDRDMPLPATFLRWARQEPELARMYAEATEIRTDLFFDGIVSDADDSDAFRAKNRIMAKKIQAEKYNPKKYAQRSVELRPGDEDPGAGIVDHTAEIRRKIDEMAARSERERSQTAGAGGK